MDGYLGLGLGVFMPSRMIWIKWNQKEYNAGLNRKNANNSQKDLLSKKEVKTEKFEKQRAVNQKNLMQVTLKKS